MSSTNDFKIKNGRLSKYLGADTEAVIPEGVTIIGEKAFSQNLLLQKVVIPSSVTTIEKNAFEDCKDLVDITLSEGVTTIQENAFWGCSRLKRLAFPASAVDLGTGLLSALHGCWNLEDMTVAEGNSIYASLDGVLYNKDKTVLIRCPNGMEGEFRIPDGVTTIGAAAFQYCVNLTGIHIPDSVTVIGREAFSSCRSLTTISIPDSVKAIGEFAFTGCRSLTAIQIPNKLTELSWSVFWKCESLTDVTIPCGIQKIEDGAFHDCRRLSTVRIPDSVTAIGFEAFCGCESLTEVHIPDSVTYIGGSAFYGCESLTEVHIPDSVTHIGGSAFCGCENLTEVHIPNHFSELSYTDLAAKFGEWQAFIMAVKNKAFTKARAYIKDDSHKEDFFKLLLDAPKTKFLPLFLGLWKLIDLQDWFAYMRLAERKYGEAEAVLLEYKTTHYTADYLRKLAEAKKERPKKTLADWRKIFTIRLTEKTAAITGVKEKNAILNINLPTTMGEYTVTAIADAAFQNRRNLRGFHMPDSITDVGSYCFEFCQKLKSVTLSSSLKNIKKRTFINCSELKSIVIPTGVEVIEACAFAYCNDLNSVTIPESVKTIGENAFIGCCSLTIHAPAGSYAEAYAKKNNIPFATE